jgi:ABC-type nickel/cobalt efflux system permease component RcnA
MIDKICELIADFIFVMGLIGCPMLIVIFYLLISYNSNYYIGIFVCIIYELIYWYWIIKD